LRDGEKNVCKDHTEARGCLRLHVDFIGTEIDKNYIKIANELIAKRKIELNRKDAVLALTKSGKQGELNYGDRSK